MWKTEEIYKAEKIGERAKPCPMPMSTLKKKERIVLIVLYFSTY